MSNDPVLYGARAYQDETRNWAEEVRHWVDKIAAEQEGRPYQARALASEVIHQLKSEDLDLLLGFLYAQAEEMIYQMIKRRDASARTAARHRRPSSRFAEAVRQSRAGDDTHLRQWLSAPFTTVDNLRKPLGEMTRGELEHTASTYSTRASQNLMTAAFLRVIARKLRDGEQVKARFTESDLVVLWNDTEPED